MIEIISRNSYTELASQITPLSKSDANRERKKMTNRQRKRAKMRKREGLLKTYNDLVETIKCFDMHILFPHETTFSNVSFDKTTSITTHCQT